MTVSVLRGHPVSVLQGLVLTISALARGSQNVLAAMFKEKKTKEKSTLFSDHNRSLLRQQPRAATVFTAPHCFVEGGWCLLSICLQRPQRVCILLCL